MLEKIVRKSSKGYAGGSMHQRIKLISSSWRVMHESIASKRSPRKAQRSQSSVRASCSSEDEESLCGGGEGVRSSGTVGGRSCFRTLWSSISFWYPKDAIAATPIAKEHLILTKGSSSRGSLKCWQKRVTWLGIWKRWILCSQLCHFHLHQPKFKQRSVSLKEYRKSNGGQILWIQQ